MICTQPCEQLIRIVRLGVETRLIPNQRRNDIKRLALPFRQVRRPRFMPDQITENRHGDQGGGNAPFDASPGPAERTAEPYASENILPQIRRHFDGAQLFGHGCIECDRLSEPAFQNRIASNLLERFGKAWVTGVLASRPIRTQKKFRFAVIHVFPPFCLIGRQRLYFRQLSLLRPVGDAKVLCRVKVATSPCQSAPRACPRFPDMKIVPDKTASAVRETALPLRAMLVTLSRCRTRLHSVSLSSPLHA